VTALTIWGETSIVTDMTTAEVATRAFAQELERLESRGELTLEEPDRAGRRGALLIAAASVWARHLDGLLEAEQVRALLGVRSRQAVHDLVRRGRLLRVRDSAGRALYPANQFDRHGRPFPVVGDVIGTFQAAGVSSWTIASFLGSAQVILDGKTPRSWLLDGGDPGPVREAARRIAGRLAH
jgi:hypothetical protein